jgi:hypothetical protein
VPTDWQVSQAHFAPASLTSPAVHDLVPPHAVEKDEFVRAIMDARVRMNRPVLNQPLNERIGERMFAENQRRLLSTQFYSSAIR